MYATVTEALEAYGARRVQEGRQEGRRELLVSYAAHRYDPAVATALQDFLATLDPVPDIPFALLDELMEAYRQGEAMTHWWEQHWATAAAEPETPLSSSEVS